MGMILLAWCDFLEESFSYKEVQFKRFCLPVKTSCLPAENFNRTPELKLIKFSSKQLLYSIAGRAALQKRIMALLRQLDRQTAGNIQVQHFECECKDKIGDRVEQKYRTCF